MYLFIKKKKEYIYIYKILKYILKKNCPLKDGTKKILKTEKEGNGGEGEYMRVYTRT